MIGFSESSETMVRTKVVLLPHWSVTVKVTGWSIRQLNWNWLSSKNWGSGWGNLE